MHKRKMKIPGLWLLPFCPYKVPVRIAIGLSPPAPFHRLVDGVGERGLELDRTASGPSRVAHT